MVKNSSVFDCEHWWTHPVQAKRCLQSRWQGWSKVWQRWKSSAHSLPVWHSNCSQWRSTLKEEGSCHRHLKRNTYKLECLIHYKDRNEITFTFGATHAAHSLSHIHFMFIKSIKYKLMVWSTLTFLKRLLLSNTWGACRSKVRETILYIKMKQLEVKGFHEKKSVICCSYMHLEGSH